MCWQPRGPEYGNLNICQNVLKDSTFHAAQSRKPKIYRINENAKMDWTELNPRAFRMVNSELILYVGSKKEWFMSIEVSGQLHAPIASNLAKD
jgi:hypothetical protein